MFNNLNHFKAVLTAQLFVLPADQNYFTARFLALHGIYDEFQWQCAHALEKYMKAALIANGISVKKFGHKIVELYETCEEFLSPLSITKFNKPPKVPDCLWEDGDVKSFIKKYNQQGNPDSRYGLESWAFRGADLFKFDLLCHNFRRLTIGLEWIIGDDFDASHLKQYYGLSYRQALIENTMLQPRGGINIREFSANQISVTQLDDILYYWNFADHRGESDLIRPAPFILSSEMGFMRNSYIFLFYEHLLENGGKSIPYLKDGIAWLLKNAKLNPNLVKEFRKLMG